MYIYIYSSLRVISGGYIWDIQYISYIIQHSPCLKNEDLHAFWRGMWVFGNRLYLCPNFGLNWSSKLTRLESYKYMYSYDVIPCEKYDSTFEVSCIYIQYGELLFWQLSDPICLTQWSLASSLVFPTLSYQCLFCSCGRLCRSLCFGTTVVFTICRIIILMCTILLVPHSRIRFWNITSSYLSDGNLSKQFSALIVSCDVICSYLCSLATEVYDFWLMTWRND